MATEIIQNDDIARFQGSHQKLFDIGKEALAIDWIVEHARRIDTVVPKRRDEGHGLPVAVRNFGRQAPLTWSPATDWCHIRLGPGLVDKDQAFGINPGLMFFPPGAAPGDIGAILLGRQHAFF